jgi:hypothetical protein
LPEEDWFCPPQIGCKKKPTAAPAAPAAIPEPINAQSQPQQDTTQPIPAQEEHHTGEPAQQQ